MLFFGNTRLGGKENLEKGMVDVTLLLGKTRNVGEKELYDSYDKCKRVEAFGSLSPSVGQETLTSYDKSLQGVRMGSKPIG